MRPPFARILRALRVFSVPARGMSNYLLRAVDDIAEEAGHARPQASAAGRRETTRLYMQSALTRARGCAVAAIHTIRRAIWRRLMEVDSVEANIRPDFATFDLMRRGGRGRTPSARG